MPVLADRVDRLEDIIAQTSLELRAASARADRADARSAAADTRMEQFVLEMREFKNEMRTASAVADARMERFEREMREFKNEMRTASAAADARSAAADTRMDRFETDMRTFQREIRRDLGEAANKTGRLVEDMIYPGIPKIFRQITGLNEDQIDYASIRVKKRKPSFREFDAVIAGGGYVLINETKATLRPEYINDFYTLMCEKIRLYFPEYQAEKFIGVVSSLYADEAVVAQGGKLGFFVLGFADDLLDVLNPPDFTPRYF